MSSPGSASATDRDGVKPAEEMSADSAAPGWPPAEQRPAINRREKKRKVKVEDGHPLPAPCAPAWLLRQSTRFTGLTPALRTPSTLPGVYLVKSRSRDVVVLPGN